VLAFDMGGVSVAVLGSTATISISLGLRALISALFGSFLFLIWSRAVSRLASASIHAQRATRSVLKAVISETSPAISMLAFPITVAAAVTCVHVTGVGLWAGIILDILCSGMFNPIAIATNATSHTARTAVRAALPQIALFGKCIVGTASFSAILVPIVLVGASIVVVLAPLAACATARYICATLVRRNRATQSVEGGEMPEEGYYEPMFLLKTNGLLLSSVKTRARVLRLASNSARSTDLKANGQLGAGMPGSISTTMTAGVL
jgi:hypothetical protein